MGKFDTADKSRNSPEIAVSPGAIVIGVLAAVDRDGRPLVDFPGNPGPDPVEAMSTISLSKTHASKQVALLFNNGDLLQPVIMGLLHNPLDELLENFELIPAGESGSDPFAQDQDDAKEEAKITRDSENVVYVDGERVSIEGAEEVTFKCGKASITLTRSGKILIRGTYLLNRSSGVNRIMGGSVQVN